MDGTGRATGLPDDLHSLSRDASVAPVKRVLARLVGQDTVMQATPFAVDVLVGMLRDGTVRNRPAVHELPRQFLAAALQGLDRPDELPDIDLGALLDSCTLLPPPDPDVDEEQVFEEWMPGEHEQSEWARVTVALILGHSSVLPLGVAARRHRS